MNPSNNPELTLNMLRKMPKVYLPNENHKFGEPFFLSKSYLNYYKIS